MQLTRVQLLSPSEGHHQEPFLSLLYSTSTSLTFHPLNATPTHLLSSLGEVGGATSVSCFEVDRDVTTVACGTSAFGYKVSTLKYEIYYVRVSPGAAV